MPSCSAACTKQGKKYYWWSTFPVVIVDGSGYLVGPSCLLHHLLVGVEPCLSFSNIYTHSVLGGMAAVIGVSGCQSFLARG